MRTFGQTLRWLLGSVDAYRRKWDTPYRVIRSRGEVNQSAVARAIMDHARATGGDRTRSLKAWRTQVNRAMQDRACTEEFLDTVIEVFAIDENPVHENVLRGRHAQQFSPDQAGHFAWVPDEVVQRITRLRRHRTVSVHEQHEIGSLGRPVAHRTIQVIEATAADCDRYFFVHDAGVNAVDVVRGGSIVDEYPAVHGLVCTEFAFNRTVPPGEHHSFELRTRFADGADLPPMFRRGSSATIQNLEMSVCFDPSRLPSYVAWASWQGLDGPAQIIEEVKPSVDGCVHRYVEISTDPLVGFLWEWD